MPAPRIVRRSDRDGRPGGWLVRWQELDGRQRKKSFAKKAEAEQYAAELTTSFVRGQYVPPAAGRVTVGEWGTAWLDRRTSVLKPKSAASALSLWRAQIEPRWSKVRIDEIRPSDVERWVADMTAAGLSASRTRQACHQLGAILEAAVRDGRLARNPAVGVGLPRLSKSREHLYLTHEQVAALADACGPWRALVLLAAYSGMRWAEIVGLRVAAVDADRRRIRVATTLSEVNGIFHEVTTKSHAARDVVVPRFVVDAVREHMVGKGGAELVFTTDRSAAPLRSQNWTRRVFAPATVAVGVPGFRVHELRHTAASLAVSAGANVLTVARMLGHADPSVTLRVYADLFPDDLENVADRLEIAAASPRPRPAGTYASELPDAADA